MNLVHESIPITDDDWFAVASQILKNVCVIKTCSLIWKENWFYSYKKTGNGCIVINKKIVNISAVTLSFGRKNYQALLIKSQAMFKGLFSIIILSIVLYRYLDLIVCPFKYSTRCLYIEFSVCINLLQAAKWWYS